MLNSEQALALSVAISGHNLLICGQAGTGKTHTIKSVYGVLSRQRRVSLLCTTGMACLQYNEYNAKTVHSWAGLYDGRYDLLTLKNLVLHDDKYDSVRKSVREAEVLIVDEVSMLSKNLFEQLEMVCRLMLDDEKYFGGLQVILCGDFFQLPPVPDPLHNDDGKFCFESEVFKNCISHKIMLERVMRQEEHLLIQAVRESAMGSISTEVDQFLISLDLQEPTSEDLNYIHLFARNIEATIYNTDCLGKIDVEGKIYKALRNSGSQKYLNKILAPNYLHLKVSCPVILLVNIGGKLVNGLKGVVRSLKDEAVTVYFASIDQTHEIKRFLFTKYNSMHKSIVAEREQFPLVLGYGMTIHKAQGMTIERLVVHCKGIFQAGQLSVAIGRAVSSEGLRLCNYRKGLCFPPKALISQFQGTASFQYMGDYSCCRNNQCTYVNTTVNETDSVHSDTDSEFDQDDIDFIEQTLFEHAEDLLDTELPGYIDIDRLKTLSKSDEPVTDLQKQINKICENCDHEKLTKFCKREYKRTSELLTDISSDQKTTPKEWSSVFAANHKYLTSEKYKTDVKLLFSIQTISSEHLQFTSNIVMEIVKLCIHNIAKDVRFNKEQPQITTLPMSESGKGKIRYVAGMCVTKTSHHYINTVISNQNNPDKKTQKAVKEAEVKVFLLKNLVADGDLDYESDKTLQEIERRQNARKALTYVTDQCFQFFLTLDGRINRLLNTEVFKSKKMNVFEYTLRQVTEDEELQMLFSELFIDESPDIVHSLYKEILHKFLMVCHKQFLNDTKDRIYVMKKKAHREEIQKKTEQRKSVVDVSMKDIVMDKSDKKESSHMKLKLNCAANSKYLCGREFTKVKLGQLCEAYGVPYAKTMRKEVIASKLGEEIMSADKVLNPDLLSADPVQPSKSTGTKIRKRATAPEKDSGKIKKAAVTKHFCCMCKEECVEGEAWIDCNVCNYGMHRTCDDISDGEWEDLQSDDRGWVCSSCTSEPRLLGRSSAQLSTQPTNQLTLI